MFCVNCGAEIPDNSSYCLNCGQDLGKYQEKSSAFDVDMEHSEVVLKDEYLEKVLHEPVAPYLSSTLNIINHLVEGLVLAAIFYVITIYWGQLTLPIVCNLIYCIGLVIVLWHSNITYQQYIVARVSIFETLIPIIIGIFQCVLVLAVVQPIYIFTLLVIPIKSMLVLLLWDQNRKNKDPIAFKIWKEHFKKLGSEFSKDMFDEFRKAGETGMRLTFFIIIIISILTLFNYFAPIDSAIKTYISFIILVIFLILNSYFDLNHFFNNSEKLKKYGYKW
jgi:zinc-ribbon domain